MRPGKATGRALGLAALAFLAGAPACRRAPAALRLERIETASPPAALRLPERSPFAHRVKRVQGTRPGARLAAGETRAFDVDVPRASRLVFSFGIGAGAPREGSLRVSLLANGRSARARSVPMRSRGRWWTEEVAVPSAGRVRLEFRFEYLDAAGRPGAAPGGGRAWISFAAPRLYVPEAAERPRRVLIWISQDALRADHLGAYGYARPTSPRFDEFARGAVVFERAIVAAPWTLPSLASQFTSTWPSEHGAVLRDRARAPSCATVFEALARDGFTVLGVVASGFVSSEYGLDAGFDALVHVAADADKLNRQALRLLDEAPGGDLALFVHYFDTHHVYDPPPPYDTLFDAGYRGALDLRTFQHRGRLSPADVEHVRARYDGAVRFADTQIGALLGALDERRLLESAVVVMTADHGEQLGDHGGWFHAEVHEEILRVPLAIRAPGCAPRRVPGPVSLIDLAPTLLDLLRSPAPATFRGRSLQPLMRGEPGERSVVLSDNEYTPRRATRQLALHEGRWKYALIIDRDGRWPPLVREERLFDLGADPGERRRAANEEARLRLRQEALRYLEAQLAGRAVGRQIELTDETRAGLEALGYVD